ncbi:hypothetical protein [Flavobacterium sp. ACN6]|uniref:hypothetical protein n=1 Tax=Flavobacterium sp. ACN6 TaxID=1920426 RepID=UPI001142FC68|nr:hypothetical protein [Flavobacterium sp. ACN6]
MKNILILLFSTILLYSKCSTPQSNAKLNKSQITLIKNDSIKIKTDSSLSDIKEISPINIIKAKLLENEYSHHKDIQITFKNSGKKSIKAIKFEWFCINSFDKPANGKYFYGEGRFTENFTSLIHPNHTKTKIWEDFSTDAYKITKIRVYYIVFNDGTKWGNDDH